MSRGTDSGEALPEVWQGETLPDVWDGPDGLEPEPSNPESSEVEGADPARVDRRALPSVGSGASKARSDRDEPTDGLATIYGDLPGFGAVFDDRVPPHQRIDSGSKASGPMDAAAIGLVGHVIVPGCIVAMVSALLFFLYDIRSVFLPGAGALKWLGFCFVVATVLIARFDRLQGGRLEQGLLPAKAYGVLLAAATVGTMALSPWEAPEVGIWGPLSNGFIIYLVWRFASWLTLALSSDLDELEDSGPKLYGLERLEMERLQQQRDGAGPISVYEIGRRRARSRISARESDPQKAASSIAKLTVLGLVIFALGEPALLAGHEHAGPKALAAMIVFLGSAALLSAAAGSFSDQKRLRRLGGHGGASAWFGRLAMAAALAVLMLAMALGTPGLRFAGSGEIQSLKVDNGRVVDDGHEGEEPVEAEDERARRSDQPDDSDGGSSRQPAREDKLRESSRSLPPFLSLMAKLGQFLRLPFMIVAGILVLYGAIRFLPGLLKALASGDWGRRFRSAFRRLGLAKRGGADHAQASQKILDPFRDLDRLAVLPADEAIPTAYRRLQDLWRRGGYAPADHLTPSERVAAMPMALRPLKDPSARLTEIYQRCAFGPEEPTNEDRRQVLDLLKGMRDEARPL